MSAPTSPLEWAALSLAQRVLDHLGDTSTNKELLVEQANRMVSNVRSELAARAKGQHVFGCACDGCVVPAARKAARAFTKAHAEHGAAVARPYRDGTSRWEWRVCPCGDRLMALKEVAAA